MGTKRAAEPEGGEDKYGARHWCLTIKARGDYALVIVEDEAEKHALRWANYQREEGGDSGYVHWQAYVEFKKPVKGVTCRLIFAHRGDRGQLRQLERGDVHWERRRGSREQARDYCQKPDSRSSADGSGPFEWGSYCRSDCTDIRCVTPVFCAHCARCHTRYLCSSQREAAWRLATAGEILLETFHEDDMSPWADMFVTNNCMTLIHKL